MKHPVRLERHSGVAVILIENPPVNALGHAVRAGILAAMNAAVADPQVKAIVIAARGRTFSAGADISEFGKPFGEPGLPELCDFIEASEKPVVAALHGTVLGGGFELAIACHYRIAEKTTLMGLPEIKLGLLPGAGGTQRTPRLIGAGPALDMILSGMQISAPDALDLGLIDRINPGPDLRDAAIALAEEKASKGPYRTCDLRGHLHDGVGYMAEIAERREQLPKKAFAEQKILKCVEAALLLPFPSGRAMEYRSFLECMNSATSIGLRHAFFAERRAPKFPETGEGRGIDTVAIVGDLADVEIAVACMNAGLSVIIVEEDEVGIGAALDRIGPLYEASVQNGRMSETAATQALSRMNFTTKIEEISEADVIIEVVGDAYDMKSAVLKMIAGHAKKGAVIATQNSIFKLDDLAKASWRARDVIGVNFVARHSHAAIVEIVPGSHSAADAVLTLRDLAKRLGRIPVRVAGGTGLISDRLGARMRQVADALLVHGALPDEVDGVLLSFGFSQGIFEEQDRIGLDVVAVPRAIVPLPNSPTDELFEKMCLSGWFGRKSGRGYYIYGADGMARGNNAELAKITEEIRAKAGIEHREFSARDILDWILMAGVNEAALLIEQERVLHPSDIDVVMVHAHGYPRERGGPLLDADTATIWEVSKRIEKLAAADRALWQVSPLLEVLANERQKFADLTTA